MSEANEILRTIFDAALASADPYYAVQKNVKLENDVLHIAAQQYDLKVFERVFVVGAGKATARMAQAIESILGNRISAGLIIVKHGHSMPLNIISQMEAAHPVPDEAGVAGTKRILEMVRTADAKSLVICLLSGGGSALLVAPAKSITLKNKQETTNLLLLAGATIDEMNAVRKHLSAVKGGMLAKAAYPAQLATLLLSDVIGDRLDVIASGPTAPDDSTFDTAQAVIAKYGLQKSIPPSVSNYFQMGLKILIPETLKNGDRCFDGTCHVIIGSISLALKAALKQSGALGLPAKIINTKLHGNARDAAGYLAETARKTLAKMRAGEKCCLLSGGETTVTVTGSGKGGRNQELALAFALEIEEMDGATLLSAGTDGSDGPTDATGAIVNGNTTPLARNLGIDPHIHLTNNDSYNFFRKMDELSGSHHQLITGPTGTNVMDIQLLLLRKPETG